MDRGERSVSCGPVVTTALRESCTTVSGRAFPRSVHRPARSGRAAIPLLLAALLLAACASGPDGPPLERVVDLPGDARSAVVYEQAGRDFRQTLLADPTIAPSSFYSTGRTDPLAKLVTVEQLQVVVDALAAQGLFTDARDTTLPGAPASLTVTIGERTWVWSRHPGMSTDELTRYFAALQGFQNIYNRVESFHALPGRDAVTEPERIERSNAAARERGDSDDRRLR